MNAKTIPDKDNWLFNYPIYPEEASIETLHGGKKIVRTTEDEKPFLAFDRDEIEYERMMLLSFKESKAYDKSSVNFKLWVDQRIELIKRFISEYHYNA